jgi:glycosyltransferase involved in cell wall biosynthesis
MADRSTPAVSVVIPVYNGANYLPESINSVLIQSFSDHELIVVDDGSTDDTWEIIRSYGERVRGIRKSNGGVASALNEGIKVSKGKWIAWLSHDDVYLPDKIEKQVDFLSRFTENKACNTGVYDIDAQGNIVRENRGVWYPQHEAIRMLFRSTYINGSSMLFDRACFDIVGLFNERLKATQDVDMWLRMVQHVGIGLLDEPLLKYRSHSSQGSWNLRVHDEEKRFVFGSVYNQLGVGGIFPELAQTSKNPEVIAYGYEWFGDMMLVYHRLFKYSKELYGHSYAIWPSLRNPALIKYLFSIVLSMFEPLYLPVSRSVGRWIIESRIKQVWYRI